MTRGVAALTNREARSAGLSSSETQEPLRLHKQADVGRANWITIGSVAAGSTLPQRVPIFGRDLC